MYATLFEAKSRKQKKKTQSTSDGWSTIKTYIIQYDEVEGLELLMTPPPHMFRILIDVLDQILQGCSSNNRKEVFILSHNARGRQV